MHVHMHVCVCTYIYIYIYIHIYIHIYIYRHTYTLIHIYTHRCIHTYTYICIHTCVDHISRYVSCMQLYAYVHVYRLQEPQVLPPHDWLRWGPRQNTQDPHDPRVMSCHAMPCHVRSNCDIILMCVNIL